MSTSASSPAFEYQKSLSAFTTFGIGGPAKTFIVVSNHQEMRSALNYAQLNQVPFFILGKGSNTLFDDRGFNGVVIANRIQFLEQQEDGVFQAGAGYSFSLLGSQTARQGWAGLEFASGIPGSVGGAVYMNAGANGTETCEALISVDFMTPEGEIQTYQKEDLQFSYRSSLFQKKEGAILSATFQLQKSKLAREKQLSIIRYRQATQPYGSRSAGCIFRNPSEISAGSLIDYIGLKGLSIGGAKVSSLHANFIVAEGSATAAEILALVKIVQEKVKSIAGVELESEVCYVPYERI